MKALGAVAKKKIIELAEALIDQKKARILMHPLKASEDFWYGSGSMVTDEQGQFYLCGRYRNSGDSRTGLEAAISSPPSPGRCRTWACADSVRKVT